MPALEVLSNAVAWLPWSPAAFARAHAERKPVLLSIAAVWCHWCHEMDRTSYADPSIVTLINTRFIPIRVDADERPDISERYNLGGWPTTAFLTPDGFGARRRHVRAARTAGGCARAGRRRVPRARRRVAGRIARKPRRRRSPDGALSVDERCDRIFSTFDEDHGGFGIEPKFPLVAPVHLALDLFAETRDPRYETIAVSTLDAMGWGGLYDEVDGGFFRYATTRDWQLPHVEKLLEGNAALLRLYLDAGAVLETARFTERGADTLRYIQNWLADPVDGGWWGSQDADGRYYAADSVEGRRALPPPPVGRVLFTDWNAAMVSAALHAARVFDDDGLRQFALKSLERVLLACYKPGGGVAHYFDGEARVRGLLGDQLAMIAASLDAFDVSNNIVYEMMAEELAHHAIRLMWDERDGGFLDRAAEPAGGSRRSA